MDSKYLLLGLGNILLRDEGIGVHVVNAIKDHYVLHPEVDIIDGGTLGLCLLPLLVGREKILFVDAVDFGREPGFIGGLADSDIPATMEMKLSFDELGLPDVLAVLKFTEDKIPEMFLIGIQPQTIAPGLELSATLKAELPHLIASVVNKLANWGIYATPG